MWRSSVASFLSRAHVLKAKPASWCSEARFKNLYAYFHFQTGSASVSMSKGELLKSKTPAEFFAENQNIAGFDNPGKSLYTTVREFVENSLDAAETIRVLPEIQLSIEEMTSDDFNKLRGIGATARTDDDLYRRPEAKNGKKRSADGAVGKPKQAMFYKVVCKDNGLGMPHDRLPDMLGRVLSGTKYGVRQTRGKFGLGAKMALIWSKKSTGLPIEVVTGYAPNGKAPKQLTYCKLDIDIYKNQPHVHRHEKRPNGEGWCGTEISVIIGGNWSTYKSRLVQYLQQLAVITPYAQFHLDFKCGSDHKKDFSVRYERRSEQMPPPAREVKHHPSSVNNLLMRQLLDLNSSKTLPSFFAQEFSSIPKALASRLIAELGTKFTETTKCSEVDAKQVHRIVQLFSEVTFEAPDGESLSPAGEYNLRLGILKELQPNMVATFKEPPAVFEGHCFIVEGGVCLGGEKAKEGITVHRFANRIPLLFESGADVATRTATKRIK
jgi:DNA topoisomerase VI B subunit